ncbi:HutD family protein [Mesorhizobium sp. B2-5-13]|uniref:HutD/Ves family protein n=1 Tax=unclassified Mesorhizobium TaxID=325217 RepID=UPI0011283A02|nr:MULTISPECIES: HutD family protein [unclassified Mesorhizobium]TPJ39064.1 HutD family protein [Mesorhizobium sp. B2-6-5]TPJ85504.1 HutD family protein [Mesorhizobium sp. B2-5-13]TPK49290.1 HutD family protein [Mesorhizobium sp. B2-5-5]
MRVLRATDYRVMPWKNGGGTTTEIAVSPDGAGLDDFDWRVSMARVERSGPFSNFAGIDRTLSVLEGEGIVLDVAGRPPERVTPASQPFSFPADQPTSAALIAGPITDLNVMTRRGRMLHSVERLAISTPAEIPAEAGPTLILCHGGDAIFAGAAPVRLGPLDTLLLGPDASVLRVQPAPDATLFVIRIIAAA